MHARRVADAAGIGFGDVHDGSVQVARAVRYGVYFGVHGTDAMSVFHAAAGFRAMHEAAGRAVEADADDVVVLD